MKIAMAINQKGGLKNKIAEHFGQAKYYLIYTTESKLFEILENPEFFQKSELPPDFLHRKKTEAVIAFGLGPRAFDRFNEYKIKMYKATEKTILENIQALQKGKLRQLNEGDIF